MERNKDTRKKQIVEYIDIHINVFRFLPQSWICQFVLMRHVGVDKENKSSNENSSSEGKQKNLREQYTARENKQNPKKTATKQQIF